MGVRPLRNLVLVERVIHEKTPGGIIIPETFEAKHSPRLKMLAKADYFEAKVIACGPDVRDLKPEDRAYVFTFADGDGSALYTGVSADGKRADQSRQIFVKYPDDFVCAMDEEPMTRGEYIAEVARICRPAWPSDDHPAEDLK